MIRISAHARASIRQMGRERPCGAPALLCADRALLRHRWSRPICQDRPAGRRIQAGSPIRLSGLEVAYSGEDTAKIYVAFLEEVKKLKVQRMLCLRAVENVHPDARTVEVFPRPQSPSLFAFEPAKRAEAIHNGAGEESDTAFVQMHRILSVHEIRSGEPSLRRQVRER